MSAVYRCTSSRCPGHSDASHVCKKAADGGAGAFRCARVHPPCGTHAAPNDVCPADGTKNAFDCGRVTPACVGHPSTSDKDVCPAGTWHCQRVEPPCEGHRRPGLVCPADDVTSKVVTGSIERKLTVGLNLPWSNQYCGYDFGHPPKGWRSKHPSPRNWDAEVGPVLRRAHAAGVRVLRFFVLADALAYPESRQIEDWLVFYGDKETGKKEKHPLEALRPDAPPLPPLSDEFVADVRGLLDLCDAIGIKALPSLISFEAFFPPLFVGDGTVKHGRGALVLGRDRDAKPEHLEQFYAATLDRLLAIPGPRGEVTHPAVLAWEVANEPDWAVDKGHVSADAMCRFLGAGLDRILRAGYATSIGFVWANVKWMLPSFGARLASLAAEQKYIHQLHYYPRLGSSLPSTRDSPCGPATIIGEMASNDTGRAAWPDAEVKGSESDPDRYLFERLVRAEKQGYTMAILWSIFANDDKSGFDASMERQIAAFTGAR